VSPDGWRRLAMTGSACPKAKVQAQKRVPAGSASWPD
jgi:hypothetical protein